MPYVFVFWICPERFRTGDSFAGDVGAATAAKVPKILISFAKCVAVILEPLASLSIYTADSKP